MRFASARGLCPGPDDDTDFPFLSHELNTESRQGVVAPDARPRRRRLGRARTWRV